MTGPTTHFGFTRIGESEDLSKDNYKALTGDRDTLDAQIYALATRAFTGDPALGDPTDPPTLALLASGGALAAATTYFYRASFVDQYGLESAASDEASVTTPDQINPPTAPALSASATSGTLITGVYNYVITQVDANGGETSTSTLATLQLDVSQGTAIDIALPDIDPAAATFRIYRSRPGQQVLYLLAQVDGTTDVYTDVGTGEDQTILAPSVNSTSATSAVQVTIPGAFIPEQAMSWRIYRTLSSGAYDAASLVHEVVEPASDNSPIPTTVYTDTGGDLLSGVPRQQSATMPQGPQLDVSTMLGVLPLVSVPRGVRCLSTYGAGTLTNNEVLNVTESPAPVTPVRISAYFKTAPTTGTVSIQFADGNGHSFVLSCAAADHRSGDPAGFWRREFPLLLAAVFEAEDGTRSSSNVLIDPDLAAQSGQAVTLDTNGEWVQADMGALDPGSYQTFAKVRVLDFDTASPGQDLVVSVLRTDTNAVVATSSFNLQSSNPSNPTAVPEDYMYQELTGPVFTAPGGVDLVLRVAKATASEQLYDVDFVRYTASVATLDAGPITVTALVGGGPTDGADVNVSLWF